MCALTAGRRGRRVSVIESANRVGKKILMSGGGRCNFTNTGTTPDNFLSANPHFCKSALARYTPTHFIEMVERHHIAYHEKELGQLFCDDSSKQIVAMLLAECDQAEVRVHVGCSVDSIRQTDTGFQLDTNIGGFTVPALVIASGGLSIPSMGASWLRLRHRTPVRSPRAAGRAGRPGAVDLKRRTPGALAGVEWRGAPHRSTLRHSKSFRGAMLITHRGISGPAILQISSYWQPREALMIDLLPDTDALAWLREQRAQRPASELKTVLTELLPKRFAQRLCETSIENRPLRQYRDAELAQIAADLEHWSIIASGTEGYRTAEVTLGGRRYGRTFVNNHAVTPCPGPVFHWRSRRRDRAPGRLQLSVGLGFRTCRRLRGLTT